ncbi:MAG: hypothetical protein ABII79_09965 [bacterium]
MIQNLGLDFISRTLRSTGLLLLIFLLPGIYYFGFFPTLAVLSGGVWGMINLMFLAALIRTSLRPEQVDKLKVAGWILIKFPLLYAAGYFLIRVEQFEPLHLLIGFSTLLAVMVLKVMARALLGLDEDRRKGKSLSGTV